MKKSRKLLLIPFIFLILALLFVSTLRIAKTREDIIRDLRQELQLSDEDASISYAGDFVMDEDALLWFSIQQAYDTKYRAVRCKVLKNGKYIVKEIQKPMIYTRNIVHVLWKSEDIYLIDDPNCRSVVVQNSFGDIVSNIELSSDDIPYVYLFETPPGSYKLDFLDADGNEMR